MVEVTSGVHRVDGANPFSYIAVQGDGSLVLVDTGMSVDGRPVLEYIQSILGRKPSDLKAIVLTHCHAPYVRGASALKKATGALLLIHEQDSEFLSGKKKMQPPKGPAGILFRFSAPFLAPVPVEPDQRLHGGERVGGLTVLHTPGHTPGSIMLHDPEKKLILTADSIRYEKGRLLGPPDEFTYDMVEAKRSFMKVGELDFEFVLGGQGDLLRSADAPAKVRELGER